MKSTSKKILRQDKFLLWDWKISRRKSRNLSQKSPRIPLNHGWYTRGTHRAGSYSNNVYLQLWKVVQTINLSKPGKTPNDLKFYRPISLLPIVVKVFEKLLLTRLTRRIEKFIPNHQFGFWNAHSTIDQIQRITAKIEKALENKSVQQYSLVSSRPLRRLATRNCRIN